MSNKTNLGSEKVKKSIQHLINEARICAKTQIEIDTGQEKGVLGFAAMLTIFPVMISIFEAISGSREVSKAINKFAQEMKNDSEWLIKSSRRQSIKHDALVDIRNGLVHAMSLPPKVLLTKNAAQAQAYWNDNPGKYDCIIGIKEFIDEVERTAHRLVDDKQYAAKDFDPKSERPKDFGPIGIVHPSSEQEDITTAASAMDT